MTGEEILSLQQRRIKIHLLPTLEGILKTKKKNWKAAGKHVETLQSLDSNDKQIQIHQTKIQSTEYYFPRDQVNQEAINELQKLVKTKKKINKGDLLYKKGDSKKYMI